MAAYGHFRAGNEILKISLENVEANATVLRQATVGKIACRQRHLSDRMWPHHQTPWPWACDFAAVAEGSHLMMLKVLAIPWLRRLWSYWTDPFPILRGMGASAGSLGGSLPRNALPRWCDQLDGNIRHLCARRPGRLGTG